jgi:hypothetical protein
LGRIADPRLAAFVVWVPKVGAAEGDVAAATRVVPDARARHYWDGTGAMLRAFRPPLDLDRDAWDLYLLYGPEARWDGATPPRPRFWMHQLDVSHAPHFDAAVFAARTRALLAR